MEVLLIVNRRGRQGRRDLADVAARLAAAGIQATAHYPDSVAGMEAIIRREAVWVDAVMIGGGDGTLSAALPALLASGKPLAILPLGTANDLARSLGIPPEPLAAADVLSQGQVHAIDLGRVNGHYFFNAASIGLGVRVTQRLSGELKRRWGVLGYGRAVADALRGVRPFSARIDCDGQSHLLRSVQITVGNGRFYGGGMAVHAQAAIDDQRLDLYSLRPASAWRYLTLLPLLRRGQAGHHPQVAQMHGRRIRIETRRPRLISADGELVSRTPAVFEVVPAALPVYVPPAAAEVAEGLRNVAE